jgi:hypothetical protein
MTFERTFEYGMLNELVRNPGLFPFLGDDFSASIEDAAVIENAAVWYILARDGGVLLGFWMFAPDNGNTITWAFHTVMALDRRALTAMHELLGPHGWLWKHTPCVRAVTSVVESNAIAHRFGLRAGLKAYGRNLKSYKKDGKLQDQILLGASKPMVT